MIEQFTYTASPWGMSGNGWMVFQQSKNVTSIDVKKLYNLYRYEEPNDNIDQYKHSIQFIFLPNYFNNNAVLTQTAFTGVRWWGEPRPGDFFAHIFLIDKNTLQDSVSSRFNPVKLFMSPKIQVSFPEENGMKDKALRIYKNEIVWEPPPELPSIISLSELPTNPKLSFDCVINKISQPAIKKIGALILSIIYRMSGKLDKPIIFNCRNEASIMMMSLALDLLPPLWRINVKFAINATEYAIRCVSEFSSMTFYGTNSDLAHDFDTGISSGVDFNNDLFKFVDTSDICLFKKMLDCVGVNITIEDYNGVINCYKVSSGRKGDLDAFKKAMDFALKFPTIKYEIEKGFSSICTENNYTTLSKEYQKISIVGLFKYRMSVFEASAKQVCKKNILDMHFIDDIISELKDDVKVCYAFLDEVVAAAEEFGLDTFVNNIIETPNTLDEIVDTQYRRDVLSLTLQYKKIKNGIDDCRNKGIMCCYPKSSFEIINSLFSKVGRNVKDIVENRKFLKYCQDLTKIKSIKDVVGILEASIAKGLPNGVDVKNDIAKYFVPSSISDVVELACIYEKLGLDGRSFVCNLWQQDKDENIQQKRLIDTLKFKFEKEKTRNVVCRRNIVLFSLIFLIIGLIIGVFLGYKSKDNVIQKDIVPINKLENKNIE